MWSHIRSFHTWCGTSHKTDKYISKDLSVITCPNCITHVETIKQKRKTRIKAKNDIHFAEYSKIYGSIGNWCRSRTACHKKYLSYSSGRLKNWSQENMKLVTCEECKERVNNALSIYKKFEHVTKRLQSNIMKGYHIDTDFLKNDKAVVHIPPLLFSDPEKLNVCLDYILEMSDPS